MTKQLAKTLNECLNQEFHPKESIFNGRYTKTALFLLRMVDLNLPHPFMQKYLYNAYLDDQEITHFYKRPIFLLFKTKNYAEKEFLTLLKTLRGLPYYTWDYDLGKQDGYYLDMVVMETPEEFAKDYYHFKMGRYSKMSAKYKALFPKETNNSKGEKTESVIWGALNKSKNLKDKVAKLLSPMQDDGTTPVNPVAFQEFRNYLDTIDEIWDSPKQSEECFRFIEKEKA